MKTRSLRHAGAPLLSTVVLLGAALGSASMGGCYVEPASPLPQPPQTAVSGPEAPAPPIAPPAPPQPEIIVEEPPAPPPPPPPEPAPPAPPSPGNLWVAGNYTWNGGHYEWARGHYERPPRPNARHVPGHWEARARGRAWVGPHWE